MSTCYVLEGGAMRGNFTGGVLDYLATRRMPYPDCVIGVSAGALCGLSFCSGQVGRAIRVNTTYARDKRYLSMRSFNRTGDAYGVRFVYDQIQNRLDPFDYQAYAERPMQFWVTCTDVETGQAVYHEIEELPRDIDYVRASASMPTVSRIVQIGDEKLLDGGPADSIPVKWALDQGYDKVVVVLTRDRTFVRQPLGKLEESLIRMSYGQYPDFVSAALTRHIRYNETREEVFRLEKEGRIFVFAPTQPITVASMEHDPGKIMEIYDQGWHLARKRMDDLCAYLEIERPDSGHTFR